MLRFPHGSESAVDLSELIKVTEKVRELIKAFEGATIALHAQPLNDSLCVKAVEAERALSLKSSISKSDGI
jgi:ribosomal protein L19